MNVIFIVNEQAGSGKARRVWQKHRKQLTIPYELHCTEYAGHAVEIAQSYAAANDCSYLLVAVGGDGTVHEVIEGAAGHGHIVIGALKAGSGNDFARGYSIFATIAQLQRYVQHVASSADDAEFERVGLSVDINMTQTPNTARKLDIEQKKLTRKLDADQQLTQELDLGQLIWDEQRVSFVNNAGVGFDAYIASAVNRSRLKRLLNMIGLGKLTYLLMTVQALFRFKRFNASIYYEGKQHFFSNVWFIAICNQPFFGGGMKISPRSLASDNKLELTIVHDLSRIKLLAVFLTVFWGKHERFKEVTMLQGDTFILKLDDSAPAHVDGEGLGQMKSQQEMICTLDDRKWWLAAQEM